VRCCFGANWKRCISPSSADVGRLTSGPFHVAIFGCRAGRLQRTARASSGRTPTAWANGIGVRRTPRFFIRKLKYDDSLVSMCLSIIGCKHVLHNVSPAGRLWFTCGQSPFGTVGPPLMALDKSGWTREPPARREARCDRVRGAHELVPLAGPLTFSAPAQARRPLGRRSSGAIR
jgi:hypothetical protein